MSSVIQPNIWRRKCIEEPQDYTALYFVYIERGVETFYRLEVRNVRVYIVSFVCTESRFVLLG